MWRRAVIVFMVVYEQCHGHLAEKNEDTTCIRTITQMTFCVTRHVRVYGWLWPAYFLSFYVISDPNEDQCLQNEQKRSDFFSFEDSIRRIFRPSKLLPSRDFFKYFELNPMRFYQPLTAVKPWMKRDLGIAAQPDVRRRYARLHAANENIKSFCRLRRLTFKGSYPRWTSANTSSTISL